MAVFYFQNNPEVARDVRLFLPSQQGRIQRGLGGLQPPIILISSLNIC
jgi:hypothetical protein